MACGNETNTVESKYFTEDFLGRLFPGHPVYGPTSIALNLFFFCTSLISNGWFSFGRLKATDPSKSS